MHVSKLLSDPSALHPEVSYALLKCMLPCVETFCCAFMSGADSLLSHMLKILIYLSDFVVDLPDLFFFPEAFSIALIDIFLRVIIVCFSLLS